MILLEYQNIKILLHKITRQIGLKKLLWSKKLKKILPWTYAINDLNGENFFGTFHENELQKTNQKDFGIGKVI